MVKATLVEPIEPSIEFGDDFLSRLDAARYPLSVALWLKEDTKWTLVIGTSLYDKKGPKEAYRRLLAAISKEGPVVLGRLPIRLEGNNHPLIKSLRKMFGRTASVKGMRLGGHSIGGVWVDDAYVYRIK
jgi:hypothetical protein